MKTMRYVFVFALLAGCAPKPSSEPIAMNADVRLLGTNADYFSTVLLSVKDLTITDGARALEVTPGQARFDLTNTGQAWLAGTVAIPVGVDRIHVALTLDDFGGWETADGAGDIDARAAKISFDADVSWFEPRKMATVRLDVGSSLVLWRDGTRVLMPTLDVAY